MMVLIRRYWARSIVVAGEIGGWGDMGVGFGWDYTTRTI